MNQEQNTLPNSRDIALGRIRRVRGQRAGRSHLGPLCLEPTCVSAIRRKKQNKDAVSAGSGVGLWTAMLINRRRPWE